LTNVTSSYELPPRTTHGLQHGMVGGHVLDQHVPYWAGNLNQNGFGSVSHSELSPTRSTPVYQVSMPSRPTFGSNINLPPHINQRNKFGVRLHAGQVTHGRLRNSRVETPSTAPQFSCSRCSRNLLTEVIVLQES